MLISNIDGGGLLAAGLLVSGAFVDVVVVVVGAGGGLAVSIGLVVSVFSTPLLAAGLVLLEGLELKMSSSSSSEPNKSSFSMKKKL